MRLIGKMFLDLGGDGGCSIPEAVVTPRRISIDWQEGDLVGHLDATSQDGMHFEGHYGYPRKHPALEFELTLYKNKQEFLLFGSWCEHDTGEEGVWAFRLQTQTSKPHTPKKATARRPTPVPLRSRPPSKGRSRQKPSKRVPKAQKSDKTEATEKQTANKAKVSAPTPTPQGPKPSSRLDHLLALSPRQFEKADQSQIVADLEAAPVTAVFKVAHNAIAEPLREIAKSVFSKRYPLFGRKPK